MKALSTKRNIILPRLVGDAVRLVVIAVALNVFSLAVMAIHPEISISEDQTTLIVNDAPEQEVISFGKNVLVQKRAKGVLVIGGDVIINGRIEGDVAAVGGNVIQREQGYIGGSVIVFGGAYKPECENPLREPGTETMIFGVFEEELRSLGQDPSQLFSPNFSLSFIAQRLIVALCWFLITLLFATIAPGAVGRAVARIQLSWLKICAIGAAVILLLGGVVIGGAMVLPDYLGATLAIMGGLLVLLAYVFGRVSLQVSLGKLVQKHVLSGSNHSETLAILIGVLGWTLLLSLPYIWLIALFVVFTMGVGLILTGRVSNRWQTP